MTFLALTPLQAALLAAVTVGIIIALYFLKLRHRRVFVSSAIVWRRVLEEQTTHSFREKLRKILSIALAVTIALLIALALARPEIESLTGKNERIVIVLDTSPTMSTGTADGQTRWQHAVVKAKDLLDAGGPTTEFRITDTSGMTVSPFTTDRGEARRLVEQMSPQNIEPRFPRLDEGNSVVYFVSDGVVVHDTPSFVRSVSVFESANNAGITAFDIRSVPSTPLGYEAYLEVQNYGQTADVAVTVTGAKAETITRSAHLATGELFKEVFDLSAFSGGVVRATVRTENDALPIDDVAYGYLPMKRRIRTMLVTAGNQNLETLLKLDDHVDLVSSTPANYREAADIDAYVFDRFAPPTAPAKPALVIGAADVPWLRRVTGQVLKPEITTWAEDHPIMQYVPVRDLSIERAARIDASNLTVVAASKDAPLIVVSEKPKWVMLTFDLNASDFPLHVGFPVFVENVLSWFNRELLALRRSPGLIDVPFADAQVRTLDGKPIPAEQHLGKTVFQINEPGLYEAAQGETRVRVAVNLANRRFSNVNASVFQGQNADGGTRYWLRRQLWFYMLVAAVVLISVEWFTFHRRITL
jgi:hypothetical protein